MSEATGGAEKKAGVKGGATMTGAPPRTGGEYLIHRGKFTSVVPAEYAERPITDAASERFGEVELVETVAEQKISGTLPDGTKFGHRQVGLAYWVTDASEIEKLKRRGFDVATHDEISSSEAKGQNADKVAADARRLAAEKFKMAGGR